LEEVPARYSGQQDRCELVVEGVEDVAPIDCLLRLSQCTRDYYDCLWLKNQHSVYH
jgi:hypothetical protein